MDSKNQDQLDETFSIFFGDFFSEETDEIDLTLTEEEKKEFGQQSDQSKKNEEMLRQYEQHQIIHDEA